MDDIKFTIIIPTRNRAETFYWCLKTCVEQDYENYEIIVSDNNSADNTKQIVDEYDCPKIKYYNTGKSLSMTDNWEFALNKVSEGYVTFIGDDDGLMPHAFKAANRYLKEYKTEAIIGRVDGYKWNNISEINQRGFLRYDVNKKTQIVHSKEILNEVLFSSFDYPRLPSIYDVGFISMNVINRIKNKTNNIFFHSCIPDVYSAIVIALEIETYLSANTTFILGGMSNVSNGFSMFSPDSNKEIINTFIAENKIPFHDALEFCPSISMTIAESLFQARDLGLTTIELNINSVVENAMKEASYFKFPEMYDKIKNAVHKVIVKNNIEKEYEIALYDKHKRKSNIRKNIKNYFDNLKPSTMKNVMNIRTKANNIFDATLINFDIEKRKNSILRNNPISILLKWVYYKYIQR